MLATRLQRVIVQKSMFRVKNFTEQKPSSKKETEKNKHPTLL